MNLLLEPTDSFSYSNTFLVLPKSGSPKLQYLRPLIMLFVLWILTLIQFSSIQFSHSVLSDSLRPHGRQHTRPPCPSPTPRVYSNSCLLSRWCHPTVSSSVVPFSGLQSFPASGSFPMNQLFASSDQSIGTWASATVLPVNIQFTGFISLQSKDSQESSPAPQFKSSNSSAFSLVYGPTLISVHDY